jgi:anti-sigma regulatory factor (Ser/Thr protein kinase)
MRAFIRARAHEDGLSEAGTFEACLVATEAVTNAIRHGRGAAPDELIEVSCRSLDGRFCVEVGDRGRFISRDGSRPDDVHGRGLGLIKRLTTGFDLDTGAAGTRLRMLVGIPETPLP